MFLNFKNLLIYLFLFLLIVSVTILMKNLNTYETGNFVESTVLTLPFIQQVDYNTSLNLLSWDNDFNEVSRLEEFGNANDQLLFYENGSNYPFKMLVYNCNGKKHIQYWHSKNAAGPYSLVYNYRFSYDYTPSWGFKSNDGLYFVFCSNNSAPSEETVLLTGFSLETLSFTKNFNDFPDSGGFYEPTIDIYYMYYELNGSKSSPCSYDIGCITADNPYFNDYVKHGTVINVNETIDRKLTGDVDVIKIDDTYFLFADKSIPHPDYRIECWSSSDLLNWTFEQTVTNRYGGDACVQYVPEEEIFYMFVEYWTGSTKGHGIGYFTCEGPWSNLSYEIDPEYNRSNILRSNREESNYKIDIQNDFTLTNIN